MTDRSRGGKTSGGQDSKEALLKAAGRVFAEKGLDGCTVKDLADAAGANVSLVSYYFGGKEGLYQAVMESLGQESLGTAERVLKAAASAEEFTLRLRLFAEEFIEMHLRNGDVCRILHREFDMDNPATLKIFQKTFVHMFQRLVDFVQSGQDARFVRAELQPEVATSLIFGGLVHAIRMDRVRKALLGADLSIENESYRNLLVDTFARLATDGLFVKKNTGAKP